MPDFAALPGYYFWLFLCTEPFSTMLPAILIWSFPGATWFHHQLVPAGTDDIPPRGFMDDRTTMAIWQLGNCYMLLSLFSSFVFRAVRSTLADKPAAQEQILGACLAALAIADVTHILTTVIALPAEVLRDPSVWNATTHGNITFTVFLFASRMAWFAGVGRRRYYYGQKAKAT